VLTPVKHRNRARQTSVFNSTLVRDIAVPINAPIDQLDNITLSDVQGFKEVALPWYTDQVLPFDITLAAANEYGAAASAKLFGVEILNEGFGTSIDDSVIQQATFAFKPAFSSFRESCFVPGANLVFFNAPPFQSAAEYSPPAHTSSPQFIDLVAFARWNARPPCGRVRRQMASSSRCSIPTRKCSIGVQ